MSYFGVTVAEKNFAGARVLQKLHAGAETIAAHQHSRAYLSLVLRGRYTEVQRGAEVRLATGSAVMHPAGEWHADRFSEKTDLLVLELPDRLSDHLAFSGSRMVEGPAVARIGAILSRELHDADDVSEMVVEGVMCEVGALLLRSQRPSRSLGTIASRADALIRERFRESISLVTIAETVGAHPAHLSRTFHHEIGCTIGERIRARRVEYACARLVFALPLSEIALEAGFADQSHMTRTFRRLLGMTPGAYRSSLDHHR